MGFQRPPLEGEAAAGLELALLIASRIYLGAGVPRGNGRSVLVLPGFLGNDEYLRPLRGWLTRIGYDARASGIAFNFGTPSALLGHVLRRVEYVSAHSDGRIVIVGHSLGGIFGRAMAIMRPDLVAHVVCLGSPLNGNPRAASHPIVHQLTNMLLSEPGGVTDTDVLSGALLHERLPDTVRLTSLFTRADGVVDWRSCLDPDPRAESIEVRGTHCGLVWNEGVYRVLGGVLASIPA
jgi:pimeloyl-ACP methyl ester carboxylesterase